MIISGCGASVWTGQCVTQPSRETRHELDKQDLHFLHFLHCPPQIQCPARASTTLQKTICMAAKTRPSSQSLLPYRNSWPKNKNIDRSRLGYYPDLCFHCIETDESDKMVYSRSGGISIKTKVNSLPTQTYYSPFSSTTTYDQDRTLCSTANYNLD